ncbi:MAG: hypothetical protein CL444_04370 [Acidimicrobiaceae bacterium]|nr:hypothetical protein [Acidimicrobiaceae bacterium]
MEPLLSLTALASAAFMAGVLWLVQIVHYPLLGAVSGNEATDIAIRHQTLITRVVGPAMVIEALATGGILLVGPAESKIAGFIGFALLSVAVAVTIFRAVPLHVRIAQGQSHLVPELIRINWTRTVAWTLRIPVGVVVAHQALS